MEDRLPEPGPAGFAPRRPPARRGRCGRREVRWRSGAIPQPAEESAAPTAPKPCQAVSPHRRHSRSVDETRRRSATSPSRGAVHAPPAGPVAVTRSARSRACRRPQRLPVGQRRRAPRPSCNRAAAGSIASHDPVAGWAKARRRPSGRCSSTAEQRSRTIAPVSFRPNTKSVAATPRAQARAMRGEQRAQQHVIDQPPQGASPGGAPGGKERLVRQAHGTAARIRGRSQHQRHDRRMQVHVVVRIDVVEREAGGAERLELRPDLGRELPPNVRQQEKAQARRCRAASAACPGRVGESRDPRRRQRGAPTHDDEMEPDPQPRQQPRPRDGVRRRGAETIRMPWSGCRGDAPARSPR